MIILKKKKWIKNPLLFQVYKMIGSPLTLPVNQRYARTMITVHESKSHFGGRNMNGLRYIRTRCNLSLNELAEHLGVTRQALSAWENGKKDIPEKRLEQLEDFFGLDKKYYGEIREEDGIFIRDKAMFRYDENEKEFYRYKPRPEVTNLYSEWVTFMGDQTISLDEEYMQAQKQMQQTLAEVEDVIKWTDTAGSIAAQASCIRRGCGVYNMINEMMECMRQQKITLKMPLFFEFTNIWKAMMIAYGLTGTSDLEYRDLSEYYTGEDGEWILRLSEMFKNHWLESVEAHDRHFENMRKKKIDHRAIEETYASKSVSEQIEMMEERVRAERANNGESATVRIR